jgi:hypothetical protein
MASGMSAVKYEQYKIEGIGASRRKEVRWC